MGVLAKLSIWFIVFYVFFIFKELSSTEYLTLSICTFGGLLLWYHKKINVRFHKQILVIFFSSVLAYVWKFHYQNILSIQLSGRYLKQILLSTLVNINLNGILDTKIGLSILVLIVGIFTIIKISFLGKKLINYIKGKEINNEEVVQNDIFEERLDDC